MTLQLEDIQAFLDQNPKPVLAVVGPTASGKTGLSIKLAQRFNGEVISVDSAQVYRGMDIGTAKVDAEEQGLVMHHLIDIRDPDQAFTMADFLVEANRCITQLHQQDKTPILCGGTGLYLRALLDHYKIPKAPPNPELRAELEAFLEQEGAEALHQRLAALDPVAAERIHPNNARYVMRAIEVSQATEAPLKDQKAKPHYASLKLAIQWPREVLYERINQRVDLMIEQGLLQEVKGLLEHYPNDLKAFSALGYKEFFPYLKGESSLEDCVAQLKQNTRNFAKRQLTWFRREADIHWLSPEQAAML